MSSNTIRIVCQEDENQVVDVSAEQTETLLEKSDYFRAMFEHGTIEVGTRTINKPDWTKTTAEHIIRLICTSTTTAKTMKDARDLLVASNEILLDTTVFGHDGNNALGSPGERLWSSPQKWTLVWKSSFVLNEKNVERIWLDARIQGILLIPSDGLQLKLKVQSAAKKQPDSLFFAGFGASASSAPEFAVHSLQANAASSVLSIGGLVKMQDSNKKVFHKETISIRFPAFWFFADNITAFEEACQVSGYLHTGNSTGYYLGKEGFGRCPTFSGSFDNLYKLLVYLEALPDSVRGTIDKISLRVTAPSQSTLQKLIDATRSCETNPCTLGADFDANAYFAVKNRKDMMLMLQALAGRDSALPKNQTAPFKLIRLTHPEGIF